ncbi:MAG: hypothetical protein ACLQVW_09710 [Limisphaerales bacterium]
MNNRWLPLFLAASFAAQGQTHLHLTNWTFTNLQGHVYSNTTLRSSTPTSIAVAWDPYGYAKIDFTNLPEDIRQKFHFDPQKARDYEAYQTLQKNQKALMSEYERQRSRAIADAKKTERRDLIEVFQVVDDGVLGNLIIGIPEEYAQAATTGRTKLDYSWTRQLIMLWHYHQKVFDGACLIVTNYQIGTYQYTTVNKSDKTVPRLTDDVGIAIEYNKNPSSIMFETKAALDSGSLDSLERAKLNSRVAEQELEATLYAYPSKFPIGSFGGGLGRDIGGGIGGGVGGGLGGGIGGGLGGGIGASTNVPVTPPESLVRTNGFNTEK